MAFQVCGRCGWTCLGSSGASVETAATGTHFVVASWGVSALGGAGVLQCSVDPKP